MIFSHEYRKEKYSVFITKKLNYIVHMWTGTYRENIHFFVKSITKCSKRGWGERPSPPPLYAYVYGEQLIRLIMNCVFAQFTLTHPLQSACMQESNSSSQEISVFSHSYWQAILFSTTNSGEGKTQLFLNLCTLYIIRHL